MSCLSVITVTIGTIIVATITTSSTSITILECVQHALFGDGFQVPQV